ncbi:hypothetical protein Tco_1532233 [Tanacetum coccineum]
MHNNIMAAGSRDRPPMLATGRYAQWRSRCSCNRGFSNQQVPETNKQSRPVTNMTLRTESFMIRKEAIHLILTGIGDEIYSTVDACQTAQEMWEAIKRLQQGESLNIQDVKTNYFGSWDQFTSHEEKTFEFFYTRFYKIMNEMIRNNLTVATMLVQMFNFFLQQLQPAMVKICHNCEATTQVG